MTAYFTSMMHIRTGTSFLIKYTRGLIVVASFQYRNFLALFLQKEKRIEIFVRILLEQIFVSRSIRNLNITQNAGIVFIYASSLNDGIKGFDIITRVLVLFLMFLCFLKHDRIN